MLYERTHSATADELRLAATALSRAGHEGALESLPGDLVALTEALRAAGSALAMSGARVVPAAEAPDQGVCRRTSELRSRGRLTRRLPTDGSPRRWLSCTTRPPPHSWPRGAATRRDKPSRRCSEAPPRRLVMSHEPLPAALRPLPRRAVARRVARIRACLRHPRLDTALAQGADPWSTGELMVRAAQLASLSYRRKLEAGLIALVELAERPQPPSPYLSVRQPVVLAERDSLFALAERLGRPEPVEVAVAAQLRLLLSDPSSPALVGRSDPGELAEVTARCLERVEWDPASGRRDVAAVLPHVDDAQLDGPAVREVDRHEIPAAAADQALADGRAGGDRARPAGAAGAGDPVGRELAVARVLDVHDAAGEGDVRRFVVGDHVRVAEQRLEMRDPRLDEHVVLADLGDLLLRVAGDEPARVPQQFGEVAIADSPQLGQVASVALVVGAGEQRSGMRLLWLGHAHSLRHGSLASHGHE